MLLVVDELGMVQQFSFLHKIPQSEFIEILVGYEVAIVQTVDGIEKRRKLNFQFPHLLVGKHPRRVRKFLQSLVKLFCSLAAFIHTFPNDSCLHPRRAFHIQAHDFCKDKKKKQHTYSLTYKKTKKLPTKRRFDVLFKSTGLYKNEICASGQIGICCK